MQCGTSFYNGTLGKQLTLRFWPLIALYTVIWAIALPISGLNYLRSSHVADWATGIEYLFRVMATPMTLVFGVLAAMAVCSHLYTTRSCNFTAALPPKRTALFATHYLTGLLWLVVPVAVMTLLAAFLAIGYDLSEFASGLALVCMQTVFFYSFAVLCGMLTGHLLALPVFYAIFNGLVGGIWLLLTAIFKEFYYGYPGTWAVIPQWVDWFTPAWQLFYSTTLEYRDWVTALYAGVGVMMALAAWLLYMKRPMERAGDVVIWAGLRPVFRYGVALSSGLALGSLTRLVLGLGQLGLAVSVILWGVAGCFVGQMFLTKSVRVLRYWKGAGAIACVFAALFVGMHFDLTGYETRVPATDGVVSVSISGLDSFPSDTAANFHNIETRDPKAIALITQLHQTLVDQRPEPWAGETYAASTTLDVTYTLSNGTRLTRSYFVPLTQRDASQADTMTYLANELVNDPGLMFKSYEFDQLEEKGYRLTNCTFYTFFGDDSHDLSAWEAQTVYQAIVQDIQEGNLTRSLFAEQSQVYIDLSWSDAPIRSNQTEPLLDPSVTPTQTHYITVCVTDKAVHTMEALKQCGY